LLTASVDKTVKLWDADSGKELLALMCQAEAVTSVAFSPDGRRLLTVSSNKVAMWDVGSGKELLTPIGRAEGVSSVAFSPDGRRVLTGSVFNEAKLWDADSGKELLTLIGHSEEVSSVAFSSDGRRALAGSWDSTATLWDAMPWATDSLPGDSSMPLDTRLCLWNQERIRNADKRATVMPTAK
jgi:WD40 repeat protein